MMQPQRKTSQPFDAIDVAKTLKATIHTGGRDFVPLHEPFFKGNELKYVQECIETGWVSSVGAYVDKFEKDLAVYLGVKRVIAVVNGTAALHLCLIAAGVETGDEVLIPALTFVATANAVKYTGATPHFCDAEENYLGLCPDKLEKYLAEIATVDASGKCINKNTGKRIAAIIPMHTFGHVCDMDRINEISAKYNILVIEDAAESLGSTYKGKMAGNLSLMSAISFNGNKIITTGGGGAIATNDETLANKMKHLSTTAKTSKDGYFFHDMVGYNYRLPNINAALGCAQLEQIDKYLGIKRQLAGVYRDAINNIDGLTFIDESAHGKSNYWLCSARLDDPANLTPLLEATNKQGIMTRPVWNPMHTLPIYKDCPRMDLAISEKMARLVISLPSSVNLLPE